MTHPVQHAPLGRVERIITALRVLERERKITKSRLFDILGISSQSSFKRLKAELKRAGLPLAYDAHDGHFHLPESASVASYGIDARTRAQLAQVRTTVAALGGPVADALDDVLSVFAARIALEDPDAAAVVTSSFDPEPRDKTLLDDALDRALTAVRERRWLTFSYVRTAGGDRDRRTIQPYAVHTHEGRYYVWGIVEGERTPKLFALDRMNEVTIEGDTFDPNPEFALGDALRHSFGTMIGDGPPEPVIIAFIAEAAAYVRCRRWPAEIDMTERDDGGITLTFAVSRLEELVAWTLSFGGAATIESPPHAIALLREAALRIARAATP